ncbi:TonB-dependent receptor domain-containing protein [Massilia sp. GCM10023247]|uniref:TonB-dependent receptor domain-containing protein n=1 Tax=Massilia sp. GCM10023247 TaxID=3252643 RepID=UPI003605DE82
MTSTHRTDLLSSLLQRHRSLVLCPVLAGALIVPAAAGAQQAAAVAPAQQAAPAQTAAQPAAQPAPAAPDAAPAPGVATVSVSGARSSNRIDRQVYDVKSDPASSNDSVGDALNKVPSVAVDADGNVTLRGKNNVQILIDGKPSAMMQGENRAAAINALPAGDLESVEVLNNPGAQFGNEGGGGPIINLVMRRERRPGGFGAVNANLGTEGRGNASSFGSYTTGRMSLQGGIYMRRQKNDTEREVTRERIDANGGVAPSSQVSSGENLNEFVGMNGSFSYNLGDKDVLALTAMLNGVSSEADSVERYRGANAAGAVDNEYLRNNEREARNRNYSLGARFDHKGNLPGENLKFDLRVSGTAFEADSRDTRRYTVRPVNASADQTRQRNDNDTRVVDFTGDYDRPGESGILRVGYKVARNSNAFDNAFFDIANGTLRETVNTGRTNRFEIDETTVALYGTYQLRLSGKWGVQGGLRGEYTDVDMHQVTSSIRVGNDYFDAIPSAFLSYDWSDDTAVRLSYARRIRRPGAGDLNPFVIYRDEFNVSSGNPNLRPTNSDSLELGVETKLGKVDTNVRLYARRDTDLISERRYFIGDNVLLTTRDNEGSSRSGGLEFTFSGRATEKLTVHASGNLGYTEQTVLGSANEDKRDATSLSGRARISYQMNPSNQFQLALNAQGKVLFGEGYRQPVRTADFTYRRNLTPALSMVLNVNDLFDSQKMESITETARLREYSIQRSNGRMVSLGLSYRFGSMAAGRPGGPGMMMRGGPGGPGH